MNLICRHLVLLKYRSQALREHTAPPHTADELLSTVRTTHPPQDQGAPPPVEPACPGLWGQTMRKVSQDETGLEGLGGQQCQEWSRPVEEVYFVCYSEVLSGKVAGASYPHSHTVSQLTGRGNALHFPAACPQAKPKCQP